MKKGDIVQVNSNVKGRIYGTVISHWQFRTAKKIEPLNHRFQTLDKDSVTVQFEDGATACWGKQGIVKVFTSKFEFLVLNKLGML